MNKEPSEFLPVKPFWHPVPRPSSDSVFILGLIIGASIVGVVALACVYLCGK